MGHGSVHRLAIVCRSGLRRETCPQRCALGPWPSFIDLRGAASSGSDASWADLDKVQRTVELEAKKGRRPEIWVTAVGRLRTSARRSPLGPCDRVGSGYYGDGHLGGYPAELLVEHFSDIEVKENPKSPYDYSNMYRGPA